MSLSGSHTHPLWYAHVDREAKKEILAKTQNRIREKGQPAKHAVREPRAWQKGDDMGKAAPEGWN
jgi:hypothetical protein